jgi:hypothetical protein
MAAVGGERRATISVDPTGGVHRQQAPMTAGRIVPIVLAALWGVFILWFFASCASSFSHNSPKATFLGVRDYISPRPCRRGARAARLCCRERCSE